MGGSLEPEPSDGLFHTDAAVELYTKRIQDPALFPQEEKAVERYFTEQPGPVLDVGCGVGRVSYLLSERGFDVTGIDVSEPLVQRAQSEFPTIDFYHQDIREPRFPPNSFQYVVFSYFGIDYLYPETDRLKAIKKIHRMLKPGGLLLFSTHNRWSPILPLSLRDLGFCLKDIVDLYLRPTNLARLRSQYRYETVPLGNLKIYLTNPIHQWRQLRSCGFTPVELIGKRNGPSRYFERDPHFLAKAKKPRQ